VLRNAKDDVSEDTTGVTLKILIEKFGIPLPDLIQVRTPVREAVTVDDPSQRSIQGKVT